MTPEEIIREPTYAERVRELEAEGLSTSDAQAVADAEQLKGRTFAPDASAPNDALVIREHMRKLGQKGGKRSLETMTAEARLKRSRKAAKAAGKRHRADKLARQSAEPEK